MASNSNLPNPGFASAGEDKHWKFACDSGARVPGEKRSFANHHDLEPETGRKGTARAVNRREGISPTAMRWGIVEHFALG